MPPKYHQWTRETIDAVNLTDRNYTRAWLRAMDEFDRAPDLPTAMAAYNTAMRPVHERWKKDIAEAIALSEEPF